jgi:TonB family protein
MRQRTNERLLNWGFVLSLSLHATALAGATLLPTVVVQDDLRGIRVFDEAAPQLMTPVELVELSADHLPAAETTIQAVETVPEPASPEPTRAPKAARAKPQPVRPMPKPKSAEPAVARPQQRPTLEPTRPVAKPDPVTPVTMVPQVEPTRPEGTPGGGGGGGGGAVDLGTPSTNGDLPVPPGGGTPVGTLPGSGSGTGPGSEGGSGSGAGGGVGTGAGTGVGEGAGTGSGGGEGAGGPSGFSSRVADRKEPVVIYKGTLEYPPLAVSEGVEGTVKLKVLVTEKGTVAEVSIVESSHDRRLDTAAVAFVNGWRYQPAIQDRQPRGVYTHALVTFELK